MRNGFLGKGLLALLGVLSTAGCAVQKQNQPVNNSINKVVLESIESFNPPRATDFIPLGKEVFDYVLNGLDKDIEKEKPKEITNFFEFERAIYETASRLGYEKEKILNCTPKEAIQLTCEIIADRMDYFASFHRDYMRVQESGRKVETLKDIIEKSKNHVIFGGNIDKERAEGLRLIDEWEKERKKLDEIEGKLNNLSGLFTGAAGFDDCSSSELFIEGKPIVCRHYAAIARDIFYVLQIRNTGLQNTYVATYQDRRHTWNQAVNFSREPNGIDVSILFFDPTRYDSEGIMGLHESGKDYLRDARINTFTRTLSSGGETKLSGLK